MFAEHRLIALDNTQLHHKLKNYANNDLSQYNTCALHRGQNFKYPLILLCQHKPSPSHTHTNTHTHIKDSFQEKCLAKSFLLHTYYLFGK